MVLDTNPVDYLENVADVNTFIKKNLAFFYGNLSRVNPNLLMYF